MRKWERSPSTWTPTSRLEPTECLGDKGNEEPLRLAFYGSNDGASFIPASVMLQRLFTAEFFPVDGEIKGGIDRIKPHTVFVDLSSEQRTDGISETLKTYRNATTSPIVFLLASFLRFAQNDMVVSGRKLASSY